MIPAGRTVGHPHSGCEWPATPSTHTVEKLERLYQFWQWLPAFRVVAETLHLPSASAILGVGPSALSRSVQMLEKAMGVELFERQGRRLELTTAGRDFLVAVRDAMRRTDDGLVQARSERLRGALEVASAGAITTAYVVPALLALREQHADLVPRISSCDPVTSPGRLLRGEIDVAFLGLPVRHAEVVTEHLGELTRGVYCGPEHPLAGVSRLEAGDLAEEAFVAPPADPDGTIADGWPHRLPRRVVMQVDQVRVGCDVVESGGMIAVLPDALAQRRGSRLVRLPLDVVPAADIFAVRRRAMGPGPHADETVIGAVRAESAAAAARMV